ncbi:hypothetical protein RN001_004939 [Aquatica leii]|uniref:Protein kinase domain-containing protein n=1 Tax=Aquatica leii TaxID=1421715 RepID=A0AAN7P5Y8_9COLE|nr:hypothetical protein RN001_004939 [Aquatica leii]
MEVFNKLYSQVSNSVSSTVSQLSGVLPGNPVTREFDATCHIASGGPGLLWKIYKGYKRSTKQEAAVFVLEKRQLDKFNKSDRELVLESMRRGVAQITKIRHPRMLTIQHPLEESRESLAFATEPIFASLANILGETFNMPQPANLSDYKFYDIEIKYGLLQIGEGLTFLHNDVKLLHRNICPESIIINQQGAWKIFGFDFCVHNSGSANQPSYPFQRYDFMLPSVMQPKLDYLAPEYILTETHSLASDLFSLGMLAYVLYSINHQTLMPVKDLQQFKSHSQQLKVLSSNKLQCLPESLRDSVKMMLNVSPDLRPDAHQFIKIPFYEDVGVKTLTYLDSLLQWDNLQKSQFYKGLPEALVKLPQRVKVQQVLPCLIRDLAQPAMIPFVLPSILDIAQHCNEAEYVNQVLPHLKPVMKLIDPIQILLIFLQRMELLLKLTPGSDIQLHVLPMLYRGLDADTPQVHELCLTVLPTFAALLDHNNVKNCVLPRIKRLCLSTSTLSVRVNCLLCIGRLLEHLDKWLVIDEVLPFLPQIPSREPAVIMGILGIYKLAMTHKKLGITKEIMATRILPFLMPLCIENGLTLQQFNALVNLVKQMFEQVESEHRNKLEQLNSVKEERKILESTMPTILPGTKPTNLENVFSEFGLDNAPANSVTLEDKQRLLRQRDTMKVLQTQSMLDPIPVTQNKAQPQAKNLANTLSPVESRLWTNSISSMSASNSSNNFMNPNNNLTKEPIPAQTVMFHNTFAAVPEQNRWLNNSLQNTQGNTFAPMPIGSPQNLNQSQCRYQFKNLQPVISPYQKTK